MLPDQARKTQVLHNQRVGARLVEKTHVLHGCGQFAVQGDDIECDVGLDPAGAAIGNRLGHLLTGKIFRAAAGVEGAKPHIDRARAALHSRTHALKGAGRRQ